MEVQLGKRKITFLTSIIVAKMYPHSLHHDIGVYFHNYIWGWLRYWLFQHYLKVSSQVKRKGKVKGWRFWQSRLTACWNLSPAKDGAIVRAGTTTGPIKLARLMHYISKVKSRPLNGICEKGEVRRLGFMKPAQRLFSDEK